MKKARKCFFPLCPKHGVWNPTFVIGHNGKIGSQYPPNPSRVGMTASVVGGDIEDLLVCDEHTEASLQTYLGLNGWKDLRGMMQAIGLNGVTTNTIGLQFEHIDPKISPKPSLSAEISFLRGATLLDQGFIKNAKRT